MIRIRKSEERGHANHVWLDTYHTFSFAHYYDESHMGLGPLRVLNQDSVIPGAGFPTHGHADMEIISYVLDGVLVHEDSMGQKQSMRPGDVQLMSAGSGVTHSEFNGSDTDRLEFLQMWVVPDRQGSEPRYEQEYFSEEDRRNRLRLVVSPDGAGGSLTIYQDVRLYAGLLDAGAATDLELPPGRSAWIHVPRGSIEVNGERLDPGDGAAVTGESHLTLTGQTATEILVFDLPA